ncbi:insulin-like growth factor-binding protein-like 1 [Bombyx mandarina]|uniref:Neuroparsin n=2 Tax=Bombyx TaxID=7090 RepID=B3IUD1_BOMMO|nr:neuroparsin precursor [Bombyx mori]XP_012549557.1 neuroparsin isoform X1 [Bombyx mori]XP_028026220.1 insulin-like growth factor-binding protein-like 1 [Bombyx mandarina]BAG50366.1 neuroparsin [Bombyx mori]
MTKSGRWLAMVAVVVIVGTVRGWDCVCNPRECEVLEPSGCPGLGIVVWDSCRCCKVCARTLGENCGGFSGTCEPGLKCYEGSCTQIT